MKLFYSPTSPYARKARVVIRETGLIGSIEEVTAHIRTPENELLEYGPSGKVPALLTDDGLLLTESTIVCAYLDDMHEGPKLHPADAEARWHAAEIDGLAIALLDSLALRTREMRRPAGERSPGFLDYETERCRRCYDALAEMSERLQGPLTIAHITVGVTLGHADLRQPEDAWREGRGALADWYETFAERSSMTATKPQSN